MNTATLGLHLFATERLRTLGEAVDGSLRPRRQDDAAAAERAEALRPDAELDLRGRPLRAGVRTRLSTHRAAVPAYRHVQRRRHLRGLRSRPGLITSANPSSRYVWHWRSKGDARVPGGPVGAGGGLLRRWRGGGRTADACRALCGRRRHLRRDSAGTAVPAGLRIATLTDGDAEDPARHRAWCLLAALLGQLEPNAASSNAPEPAFLQWLVDPDDRRQRRSGSCWLCARRSGGLRRQPGTAGEAASASEAA